MAVVDNDGGYVVPRKAVLVLRCIGKGRDGRVRVKATYWDGWGLNAREIKGLPSLLGVLNADSVFPDGLDRFIEEASKASTEKQAKFTLAVMQDRPEYLARNNVKLDGAKAD